MATMNNTSSLLKETTARAIGAALVVVLMVLSAAGVSAREFTAADIKVVREAAERGEAWAQFNLGWAYAEGEGVAENDKETVKWFRKAAEQGNAGGGGDVQRR